MPSQPTSVAKNLSVSLVSACLEGDITACKSLHRVEKISKANCEELGEVDNFPRPVINNGVIVSVDGASVWSPVQVSYLSALDIAEGGKVQAPEGKKLVMTVNGAETAIAPGSYRGDIAITVV